MTSVAPIQTAKAVINTVTAKVTGSTHPGEGEENYQPDETPLSPTESKEELEKRLKARPERKDLVDRNILKDSSAAPALQAAQAGLERRQLEDKLANALQQRPKAQELVKEGILQSEEAPPA